MRVRPGMRCLRSWVVGAVALLGASAVTAQDLDEARRLPNRAWSPEEGAVARRLGDRFVVVHMEPSEVVLLPQVTAGALVDASCDEVLAVVRDVAAYPRFMPALGGLTVRESTSDTVAYEWTWQAAIFAFRGQSSVTTSGGGPRGFRAVFDTVAGDLGRSRRSMRGVPLERSTATGRAACLVSVGGHHDFRDANYLARESAPSVPTMSRSLNLVLTTALVARLRGETERRAGRARPRIETPLGDPSAVGVGASALAPLLANGGDAFAIETTDGTDLGAVVAATRMTHEEAGIRRAFFEPVTFTQGLLYGSTIDLLEQAEGSSRYRWNVSLPLLGSSGEITITNTSDHAVELSAVAGALRGGRMVLETLPAAEGTWVTLTANLDPADGVPIVAAVQATDAAFRPGLLASGMLMALRGVRRGLNEGH